MTTKPDNNKRRVALSPVRVAGSTITLLRELSKSLNLSQGETLDRAVQALAVAESFGAEHLRLAQPDSVGVLENDRWRVVPRSSLREGQRFVELPEQDESFGGEHLRLPKAESKSDGKCRCGEFFLSGTHPTITRNGFLHTEQHCKRNVLGNRNDPKRNRVTFPARTDELTEWEVPGIGKFPAEMERRTKK